MTAPLRTRRLLAAVAVAPLLSASLVACGGDDESSEPTAGESTAESQTAEPDEPAADDLEEGQEVPVDDFVDLVSAGIEESTTARMTNTSSFGDTEISGEGVVDYSTSPPSIQMTMNSPMMGGEMEMRSVDGVLYISLGNLTRGKFLKMDPSDPDSPLAKMGLGDALNQGDPLAALEGMQEGIEQVTYVGEEDVDGRQLDHFELTVDLATSVESFGADLPPSATKDLPETVTYDVWLDEEGRFGQMVMDVDVEGQSIQTEMTLDDWGTDATVEAPPAKDVTKMPNLGQLDGMVPNPA
ncbi:hypothetical protein [Nocardioides sp. SYSU DS0663]|uniref:hypothetical protein n=1 Tax=Nocardioides sp. SYSU DS0663 TaxID=3416445 RepID=UPI003F4B3592